MKKLARPVQVEEVEGEGFISLLGKPVLIMCMNYFYAGTLSGVNKEFIQLENPRIVYETGPFDTKGYKDAQALPSDTWNIQISAIESYGEAS